MEISRKYKVVMVKARETGTLNVYIDGVKMETDITEDMKKLYSDCVGQSITKREEIFSAFLGTNDIGPLTATALRTEERTEPAIARVEMSLEDKLTRGLTNLINFFTEFSFEPNFRFVNTLSHKVMESKTAAVDYVNNYFALMDNGYANEIREKVKSAEFTEILKDIEAYGKPSKVINSRFKVYYGSAGTGKTTKGMKESDGRCVICNASMLPADLMEDFTFDEGKATFKPSKLWECMTNGLPIVLDEINLLPFDSLRFLQGVLDGKTEFDYKGHKVTIKDGFQVIGTMNLSIGGMTYGLPEPLVDRCSDMQKFTLTAEQLATAILK